MPLSLLLFPPTGSALDRAIDLAEGSPAAPTHAALQLDDAWYVESVWPVARAMPVCRLSSGVRRVPLTADATQQAAITAYLLARVGTTHYSVQALVSDGVGALTGRWLPVCPGAADCSGWLAEAFVAAGVVTTAPRDPGTVTPADLARWIAAGQPRDLGALLAGTGQP